MHKLSINQGKKQPIFSSVKIPHRILVALTQQVDSVEQCSDV